MLLTDATQAGGARFAGPLPRHHRHRGALVTTVLAAVIGLALGRFALSGDRGHDHVAAATTNAAATDANTTAARIDRLQAGLRVNPNDARGLAELGAAYLQRARETADPTWYTKAGQALSRSATLAPDDALQLTASGLLALARHDFAGALRLGGRAHEIDPASADAMGVVVDAQVELGRYDDAAASVQQMVDLRPSLPSYARVSYVRELRGDAIGAIDAMSQAVIAGAGSADDVAYVQSLLGDLELSRGDVAAAETAYRRALQRRPGYGAADVGLARVDAARGDLAGAVSLLQDVATRLPFPATVALLGDVLDALGRHADAARQYDLVRAIEDLNRANGVAVDLELARFEADHPTDPGAAVDLARRALAERPTVYGEDVLAWSLHGAARNREALDHARAALRFGTRDAVLWWHLAAIEADAGQADAARRDLTTAFGINRYLTVHDRPLALALATRLGVPA